MWHLPYTQSREIIVPRRVANIKVLVTAQNVTKTLCEKGATYPGANLSRLVQWPRAAEKRRVCFLDDGGSAVELGCVFAQRD